MNSHYPQPVSGGTGVKEGIAMSEMEIRIHGEKRNISQWCAYYGISKSTVYERVHNQGLSFAEAITKPVRHRTDTMAANEKKKLCKTCKYRGRIGSNFPADLICDYIGYTGHRRPCKAENCTVYKKGKPKRPAKDENRFFMAERGRVWK